MNRKENAAHLIKLLSNAPMGLHKRNIMRKLSTNSNSTFYRALKTARSLAGIIIESKKEVYSLLQSDRNADDPFIPTDNELIALVSLQHMISNMTSGSLREVFEPLQEKLAGYLKTVDPKSIEWPQHIRMLDIHFRKIPENIFNEILQASAHRRVIRFSYIDSQGKRSDRTVSPQQLVRYKDNWYLDAWCHINKELRIFSLDSIADIRCVNQKFFRPSPELIRKIYATSFGLFSGVPTNTAVIRFTGLAARYVLRETWHPEQKLKHNDNIVQLEIPFNKPQELIKEILSWGRDAEVISPQSMRNQIAGELEKAATKYKNNRQSAEN